MNSENQPEQQPQQQLPQIEPLPKRAPTPKTFLRYPNKPENDFFDKFRAKKLCTIPETSRYKKQDALLTLRPKQGTCLDYHISETDTKLDAGMTRIHIRQVNATYEPLSLDEQPDAEDVPPPKKRKRNPSHNKYCTARKPVYEFAEEKHARLVMKKQEFYKRKMIQRIASVKQGKYIKKFREHDYLLEHCGPDWFIELSPTQKDAIDNLLNAIFHDLRFGEVTETCYILGRLGLVLRPNHKLVEIALQNCCKCAVEFLLTLYQLMNPHRTSYSLNDMLILSSVVHLTLKSTLKEMHIRLPSPPPPLEQKPSKPKRPKKCTYESPYLKPVVFIRPKPTDLETWKNRHLTFPKNPYFAYLKEIYDLRNPIFNTRSRIRISRERVSNSQDTTTLQNELLAAQVAFNEMHDYYEHDNVKLLQASIYRICNKPIQFEAVSAPTFEKSNGDCDETIDKAITEDVNTELEGTVTSTEQTTVELAVEVTVTEEFDEMDKRTITKYHCQVDTRVQQGSAQENDNSSNSADSMPDDDQEEKSKTDGEICVCTNQNRTENSPISGIDEAKDKFIDDKEGSQLIDVKKRVPSNCACRQIIEKRIEESTCQCAKCKEDREKKNIKTTYIIADTKEEQDGPIPIISDVKAGKKCTCLERYMKRVDRIDHQKEIRRTYEHLIDMGQPFIVNGVAIGPDGKPVYNLSAGIAIKSKCRCLSEHPEPPKLANMPLGRQKYAISGVHASPEGNVFIISSALPVEPCHCIEMYKEYVKQHDPCLQLYEAYMHKIKSDTEEYMEDLRNRTVNEDRDSSSSSSKCSSIQGGDEQFEGEPITDTAEESITQAVNKCSDHGSCDHSYDENYDFSLDVEFVKRNPRTGKRVCICNKVEENIEPENEKTLSQSEYEDIAAYEPSEYSRYIILKQIPTNRLEQEDIIKRLLHLLEQDNYPLARLPDCHKLPIFELWMAKRTYQYWTQDDRISTINASKYLWNHILHCKAYETKNITLGISNTNANKFTWLDAKLVKDYTSKRTFDYQRQQRQASVAMAREFFPTMFMYENPAKRFLDVYFAYMPTKEEDVFYYNVWKVFEYKNLVMDRQDAKVYRCSKLV